MNSNYNNNVNFPPPPGFIPPTNNPTSPAVADEESMASTRLPFPTEVLPPTLRNMVGEVARIQRIPDVMPGCLVLAAVSATLGRNLETKLVPNIKSRGNIFMIIGAESGVGKSICFKHCLEPIILKEKKIVDDWRREQLPRLKTKKEVLTQQIAAFKKRTRGKSPDKSWEQVIVDITPLQRQLDELEPQLVEPRLIAEDITTQKLAALMQGNGETAALLSSDGGEVINNLLGQYKKLDRVDDNLFLKAFSGDAVRVDRVARAAVSLVSPCLTMALLVQPDKISTLLGKAELTSGGFLPRLLIAQSDAEIKPIDENEAVICPQIASEYQTLVENLLINFRCREQCIEIQATPEARASLRAFDRKLLPDRLSSLGDINVFTARYNEQVCRLALVLHAAKFGVEAGTQSLGSDSVEGACKLVDFFIGEQLAVLETAREQKKSNQRGAVMKLLRTGTDFLTARKLIKKRIASKSEEATQLLESMVTESLLTVTDVPTKGRPLKQYRPMLKVISPHLQMACPPNQGAPTQ